MKYVICNSNLVNPYNKNRFPRTYLFKKDDLGNYIDFKEIRWSEGESTVIAITQTLEYLNIECVVHYGIEEMANAFNSFLDYYEKGHSFSDITELLKLELESLASNITDKLNEARSCLREIGAEARDRYVERPNTKKSNSRKNVMGCIEEQEMIRKYNDGCNANGIPNNISIRRVIVEAVDDLNKSLEF